MSEITGIFVADPHYAGRNVGNRMDDYTSAIKRKMTEALDYAKDVEADYFCILGDLWHQFDPPGTVRNAVVETLAQGNGGDEWPFDILAVVGNHDMSGRTVATLGRTAIETLHRSGVLEIFDVKPEYDLRGIHYENDIEEKEFEGEEMIWAIHANVLPTPHIGPHVLIRDFKVGPKTKLVISGHWHNGYPVTQRNDDVIFANPGSLGRPRIDDIKHDVQLAEVRYDEEDLEVRYVELTSARPASEIFPKMILEPPKDMPKRRDTSFMETLDSIRADFQSNTDSISLVREAAKAAKATGVKDEVVREAIDRIERHRKERDDD